LTATGYVGRELDLFAAARNWKAYWSSRIEPLLHGRVLEVGAGVGANAPLLLTPGVRSLVSLEPDAALAARLKASRDVAGDGRWRVFCGTLAGTREAPAFDAIVYLDVLEHIEDDARELGEAARRLRPGGVLAVLAPAHPWLFSPFDASIGHHRRYTRATLAGVAPPGLTPVVSAYLDSAGAALSLANRLLLRRSLPTPGDIAFWDRRIVPLAARLDPLAGRFFGRSVLGAWRAPGLGPGQRLAPDAAGGSSRRD
jgi:SAM-dependent methyltransferase